MKSYSKFRDGSVHCTLQMMSEKKCIPFAQITISSGSEIETVSRLYNKFFSMISEFGGFGDLIFIFVGFLYVFYNSFFMSKFVIKKFADKEGEEFDEMLLERNVNKEKLEKVKKDYVEEKLTGIDLLKNSALIEGLAYSTLDRDYITTLEIIPLLAKIVEETKGRNNIMKKKTRSPVLAIENVLEKEPSNDIEKLVKESLVRIMEQIGSSNKVKIIGSLNNGNGGLSDYLNGMKGKISPLNKLDGGKVVLKENDDVFE